MECFVTAKARLLKGSASAIVLAMLLGAPCMAVAQEAQKLAKNEDVQTAQGDRRATNVEEVVVTGTNIHGNTSMVTSLTTITRDDYERGGFLDIGEALRSIPENFSGGINTQSRFAGGNADQSGNNATLSSSPNLHALGSSATLTLLNGNRLAPAGYGLSVDLALIPTAAIERIDVLADGASAIYGADAVGGVVNIITRRHYDGVETRARFGSADGGLQTYSASGLAGGTAGKLSGVVSAEYFSQGDLQASQREASSLLPAGFQILPSQKRESFMGSGTYEILPTVSLFADGFYTHGTMEDDVALPTSITTSTVKSDQYTVRVGANTELGSSWRFNTSASRSHSNQRLPQTQFTPGAAPVMTNFDRISDVDSIDVLATGDLFRLPAGAAKVSLGGSYREESIDSRTTPNVAGSRNVKSVFGEFQLPLISEQNEVSAITGLVLSAAGRLDDYSDFGSTFVPKFGASMSLGSEFELKGTYSRSFRAPSIYESTPSYALFYKTIPDNVPGGTSRALYLTGTGRSLDPEKSENINAQIIFKSSRIPGLGASIGYYHVAYDNRIAVPDPAFLTMTNVRNAPSEMLIRSPTAEQIAALVSGARVAIRDGGTTNPNSITLIVDDRATNIARTVVSGFDGYFHYIVPLGGNEIGLFSNINYIDKFVDYSSATRGPIERVGKVFSPPHWRARTEFQWNAPRVAASLFWNYTGPSFDNRILTGTTPVNLPIGDWNTLDASLTFKIGGERSDGRNSRIILTANNLFDTQPRLITSQGGFFPTRWDPTNQSIVGRFVSVELVNKW